MPELIAESINDIPQIASRLLKDQPESLIFGFYGNLGSGKTTLIKSICKILGVQDSMNSPSFSLINEYFSDIHGEIYHFDFYRIKNLEEALDLGIEEYFYSGSYCFIEWPELIENYLPEDHVKISIIDSGNNKRKISY